MMGSLLITGFCIIILLVYLAFEKYRHSRCLQKIPLRICVTGSRGKSSVTRLVAGALNESGLPTAAKTTGSKPVCVFPDGTEVVISRRGLPSILEGKRFIKTVCRNSARAVVAEMMSIRPETLYAESRRILCPHILIITNVRLDHMEHMGSTPAEIAKSFSAAIPFHGTVFVPEEEFFSVFEKTARQRGSKIIRVPDPVSSPSNKEKSQRIRYEWEQNIRLAEKVGSFLKLEKWAVRSGMDKSRPDVGSLRIWSIREGAGSSKWLAVSAFAANDPGSTKEVLERLRKQGLFSDRRAIGILNLREDRGERTIQWFKAIQKGRFPEFDGIMLLGRQSGILKRKFSSSKTDTVFWNSRSSDPDDIMKYLFSETQGKVTLVGMGNMGGMGCRLVDLWEKTGDAYDV